MHIRRTRKGIQASVAVVDETVLQKRKKQKVIYLEFCVVSLDLSTIDDLDLLLWCSTLASVGLNLVNNVHAIHNCRDRKEEEVS